MKYIKTYEAKRGRPKNKMVECIKKFDSILNDQHVNVNPHLTQNDKNLHTFFKKGEMYNMNGPYETIRGDYIVYVNTKIKHAIGGPDYPKHIYEVFKWDKEKNKNTFSSENHFEDYFIIPEETKKLIEWWYIKKDAKKYNL